MTKQLIQDRIRIVREGAGLDRHQFAARIKKSYTAVWNWETKGTSTAFVPEDGSLRDIVAAFPNVTIEWLRNGTGTEPEFDAPAAGAEKLPAVLRKLEDSIRELERMPIIAHYLALVAARDEALAS
ncbi:MULTISPECIES: helix-turn-helix transcriptional regulator [unclassified Bradyrhizobium]|uniref:helix-turn-helix domain-containing protein n=1 Tax=unclassified Bradyrhizobium TaxID=2631580 RepID=UPI001FFBC789|nr:MULTISPECIES: helix-turn-helix transcriptional regulator [unclassified Bradyrhizobium]MCK1538475.1 hypothetical protein [Bradyrhizobium sp. 176]MCK1560673.1 hypothetical protein [Bradyrhizobium sp. 171]